MPHVKPLIPVLSPISDRVPTMPGILEIDPAYKPELIRRMAFYHYILDAGIDAENIELWRYVSNTRG